MTEERHGWLGWRCVLYDCYLEARRMTMTDELIRLPR